MKSGVCFAGALLVGLMGGAFGVAQVSVLTSVAVGMAAAVSREHAMVH